MGICVHRLRVQGPALGEPCTSLGLTCSDEQEVFERMWMLGLGVPFISHLACGVCPHMITAMIIISAVALTEPPGPRRVSERFPGLGPGGSSFSLGGDLEHPAS